MEDHTNYLMGLHDAELAEAEEDERLTRQIEEALDQEHRERASTILTSILTYMSQIEDDWDAEHVFKPLTPVEMMYADGVHVVALAQDDGLYRYRYTEWWDPGDRDEPPDGGASLDVYTLDGQEVLSC